MNVFFIIAISIISVGTLLLIAGYFTFLHACARNPLRDPAKNGVVDIERYERKGAEAVAAIREYERLEKETVCILSRDGLKLVGSYIPSSQKTNKLIIAFHGYRSCAAAEFSLICEKILGNGYSLLLPDQRSHGRSEGKYIGFGALERYDCKSWCEYAVERFGEDTEIYLYGLSMGAASVIMSTETGLPENVRAIVADCGFSTPWAVIKYRLKVKYRLPPIPLIYFMNYWSRILANFDFRDASTVEAIKKSKLPILLIHGTEDKTVPVEMSYENHSAGGNTSLRIYEGVHHVSACLSDFERYSKDFFEFLDK
ncbi:MAG: alpha/beta hydrolase [Clostridia bacterium]|nr:alpha/beta hydrolase [Clostridia bacterium]